jgi:predicted NAD/FAD-binding protein
MKQLAIIGGGIAGLTCAYKLQDRYAVTVFEGGASLGGHAQTFTTPKGHRINPYVMLFVKGAFKNFFALMDEIGFDRFRKATLSTVIHENGRILHADPPPDLRTLRQNFLSYLDPTQAPSFYHWARYAAFMYRFYRDYERGRFGPEEPVEELVRYYPEHDAVVRGWAVPFAQIKGQVTATINDLAFILFSNLYLTGLFNGELALVMPENGVAEYIDHLVAKTRATFRTRTPVQRVTRAGRQLHVETTKGDQQLFDQVIVATCPVDSARFVEPWDEELAALFSGMGELYEESLSVIHTDSSVMKGIPKRYWGTGGFNYDPVRNDNTVTLYVPGFYGYDEEVFVTYLRPYGMKVRSGEIPPASAWAALPESCRIDPARVLHVAAHHHPRWGSRVQRERFRRLHEYSGTGGLHFCGVGLDGKNSIGHEGAVTSALQVVSRLRAEIAAGHEPSSPRASAREAIERS